MTRREKLIGGLNLTDFCGVEIGALCNPMLSKAESNVIYVDYASADDLRKHYAGNKAINADSIVQTDAIWGSQSLAEAIGRKVDFVIASHVIEHVPDLITWLKELESILLVSGEIRLAIPDRRYTFDFLRRESAIAEILAMYVVGARIPQPYFILDYFLNATEVNVQAAWRGEVSEKTLHRPDNLQTVLALARDAFENGAYHDAHCWVFTPESFANLMIVFGRAGFTKLMCKRFYDTEENTDEFIVQLMPSDDKLKAEESWQTMASSARSFNSRAEDPMQVPVESNEKRARLLAEKDLALQQLQDATARVVSFEQSTSWKITRPLRALSTLFKRA